jgi:D-lactate dehydrogenase
MRIAVFSTKPYDRRFFEARNATFGHEFTWLEPRLSDQTAALAEGHDAVCVFVNDRLPRSVLETLRDGGTKVVALRCAGFNNVDLEAAEALGLTVVRVPAYSPFAVAEHTLALILALNRRIHRAYNRVREGNFALDGLLGFDLRGKTAGIIGTGRIGEAMAAILNGVGCRLLAFDPYPNEACEALGVQYVDLATLYRESDIVTLHCPLTPDTHHLIDDEAVAAMKRGVLLVNTSRGEIVDTRAVIEGLKSGQIGFLGLDVYEEEGDLFFRDLSDKVLTDDVFARLLTFPNVIITGHQAFFTEEALSNIAETTLQNVRDVETTGTSPNVVQARQVTAPDASGQPAP